MSDSFDDDIPAPASSIVPRLIEGLAVVAFIAAIVVWQNEGTLEAARRFTVAIGIGHAPTLSVDAPVMVAEQRAPKSVRTIEMSGTTFAAAENSIAIDPMSTGAIGSVDGWVAACDSPSRTFCTASQSLRAPEDSTIETSWSIEKGSDGLVGVWTLPTNVLVNRGMTLLIGTGDPKTVPYTGCGPNSCTVRAKLADNFITLMRNSQRIATEIVLQDGKRITFDFSKNGLSEALAKIGV